MFAWSSALSENFWCGVFCTISTVSTITRLNKCCCSQLGNNPFIRNITDWSWESSSYRKMMYFFFYLLRACQYKGLCSNRQSVAIFPSIHLFPEEICLFLHSFRGRVICTTDVCQEVCDGQWRVMSHGRKIPSLIKKKKTPCSLGLLTAHLFVHHMHNMKLVSQLF